MDVRSIGDNIARLRTERGISQAALAELAGISRNTVLRVENGAQLPNSDTIARICKALGTSTETLFNSPSEDENEWREPRFVELEKRITALPKEQQDLFFQMTDLIVIGMMSVKK